ncbi:MAG: hypothetical protein J5666_04815 [Bacilli bacterium]|nr:hypothetical protein [Bacilli bacterium]
MKKIRSILITSLATLAMGMTVVGVSSMTNSHKEIKKAEASSTIPVTGVYRKVTEVSELVRSETKVLIVENYSEKALSDSGGNPGYLVGTNDRLADNSDVYGNNSTIIYANSAYVVEWDVLDGIQSGTTFSFRGTINTDYERDQVAYVSYSDYDYYRENNTYHHYEGISRWMDNSGLDSTLRNASSWTITKENGELRILNVFDGRRLGYRYGEARSRFVLYDENGNLSYLTNVSLFRKTTLNPNFHEIDHGLNKTSYIQGEELDLSGLIVTVKDANDGTTFQISYNDSPDFFSHDGIVVGNGSVNTTITVAGVSINIPITVEARAEKYRKVTSDLGDYRGQYIIAAYNSNNDGHQDIEYAAFCLKYHDNPAYYASYQKYGQIINDGLNVTGDDVIFEFVVANGFYYLKEVDSGKYVGYDGEHEDFKLVDNANDALALDAVFDNVNNQSYLKQHGTNNNMYWKENGFGLANTSDNLACLYKLDLTQAELNSVSTFMSSFRNVVNACVNDGKVLTITAQQWSDLASSFTDLTPGAQGYIAGITYAHGQEAHDSFEDLIDRYDYIISKYNEFSDFMNRREAGTYVNNFGSQSNKLLNTYIPNDNNAAIIVVILVGTLSLVTTLLIFKKKYSVK